MIRRRLARLEKAKRAGTRPFVARINEGETTQEALARFFAPYGEERWPVAVLPDKCKTTKEWLERHAPKS
jgi:hypothetical protein